MNVSQDLSILHLILNASAVVQIVMAILAGVSFMSWYYIFNKWFTLRQARAQGSVPTMKDAEPSHAVRRG